MKALILLSALLPAGLIASFLGSAAPQQDETRTDHVEVREVNLDPFQAQGVNVVRALTALPQDETAEGRYRVHVVQTNSDSDDPDETGLTVASPLRGQIYTAPGTAKMAFAYRSDSGKTQQAIDNLRKAKTDEEKADARKQLSSALAEEFDEYLEHQAKELDRLEAKVKKLRGQWDKRREAKDELVALRMQTLENEANGLGWPAAGGNNFWMGSSGGPANFGTTSWSGPLPALAPMVPPVPGVVDINVVGEETDEAADEADEDLSPEPAQPPQPSRTRNRAR